MAALWLIAGHHRPGRRPFDLTLRALLTLGRLLDLHGRVATNGTASCLVRSTKGTAWILWTALSTVGFVLSATSNDLATRTAGTALLVVAATSLISALGTAALSWRFPQPVSHVFADLVRSPDSERGSGAALTKFVMEHATARHGALGARAANETLVQRFYEPLGFVEVDRSTHLIVR